MLISALNLCHKCHCGMECFVIPVDVPAFESFTSYGINVTMAKKDTTVYGEGSFLCSRCAHLTVSRSERGMVSYPVRRGTGYMQVFIERDYIQQ